MPICILLAWGTRKGGVTNGCCGHIKKVRMHGLRGIQAHVMMVVLLAGALVLIIRPAVSSGIHTQWTCIALRTRHPWSSRLLGCPLALLALWYLLLLHMLPLYMLLMLVLLLLVLRCRCMRLVELPGKLLMIHGLEGNIVHRLLGWCLRLRRERLRCRHRRSLLAVYQYGICDG